MREERGERERARRGEREGEMEERERGEGRGERGERRVERERCLV